MKTIKCKMRRTVKTTAAAFTLFELLIVLAVVVILSAVAYPTIRSIVGSEYLTSGGDQVRIHF
ncbi:MAG: prepilin-type N-terminal cleavage/methylation domain-containing protein, partial [Pirellulales bacterium]|nr:prepilin-type N-terminal cleavage/methylation domain-containing protein [Pirellulales bacterium]